MDGRARAPPRTSVIHSSLSSAWLCAFVRPAPNVIGLLTGAARGCSGGVSSIPDHSGFGFAGSSFFSSPSGAASSAAASSSSAGASFVFGFCRAGQSRGSIHAAGLVTTPCMAYFQRGV